MPHIVIYNKNKSYVEYFCSLTGANLRLHHGNGLKPTLLFTARIYRRGVMLSLLPALIPYLIIKKQRAIDALAYLKTKPDLSTARKQDWLNYSPEAKRERLRIMHEAGFRGKPGV